MKRSANILFGILAGAGFLWAGVAILMWDIGKLRQARAARNWPTAEGTVVLSTIDDRQKESTPHVVYTYTVADTEYTSNQISFDIFDKPGGEGRIESIIARYPEGTEVTVYYDPGNPSTAILEPEVYSPFFMPLIFGVLFLLGGIFVIWKTILSSSKAESASGQSVSTNNRIAATAVVSLLIYAVFVLVSCESASQETFARVLGPRPVGLSPLVFVLGLQTILFLPIPWVFWHGMRLAFQATQDGRRIGIAYLLTVGDSHPELRGSQRICIAGLVYFAVICGVWIVCAAVYGA
jgi:hypothetical protein